MPSREELEIVFKTYGEVLDVHVISGDRAPGERGALSAWPRVLREETARL